MCSSVGDLFMYSISGNRAIINGQNGAYDKKVNNSDVKCGRNAASNYMSYVNDLGDADKKTPIQFSYQYIPQGKYSTIALMGNAYEELGKRTEVPLNELNKQMVMSNVSADALDINGDGKVDIAEYATSTMAADMLDKDQTQCKIENLDGVITNKGENASLNLYRKENVEQAKGLFKEIHQTFALDKAMSEFKSNPNNMVQ